jgi:hypothetical protein
MSKSYSSFRDGTREKPAPGNPAAPPWRLDASALVRIPPPGGKPCKAVSRLRRAGPPRNPWELFIFPPCLLYVCFLGEEETRGEKPGGKPIDYRLNEKPPKTKGFSRVSSPKTGRSAGTRTLDPLIKSQLLYQLSYTSIPDKLERAKGFEPSTSTLARWSSTTELRSLFSRKEKLKYMKEGVGCKVFFGNLWVRD